MTITKPLTELSPTQIARLMQQAALTTSAYGDLLMARASEAHPRDIVLAEANYNADLALVEQAILMRGLQPGDRIRITADGPHKGQEGIVREHHYNNIMMVDWPEGSSCRSRDGVVYPSAGDVELVEEPKENTGDEAA